MSEADNAGQDPAPTGSPAQPAQAAQPAAAPAQPAAAPTAAPAAAAPAAPAQPAPAAPPAAPPAKPGDNAPWWRDALTDEKHLNVAKRLNSPADAMQAIIDLRTDNSQRIKVPDDKASEDDRSKFRKALGVPDRPEDYRIELAEGLEMNDADKAVLNAVLPAAHKHGVPGPALNAFVNEFLALSKQMEGQAEAALERFGKESEAALKREWGADFEPNMNLANRTAEVLGGPEFKKFLNTEQLVTGGMAGDNPVIARFLARIGRQMGEGELMLGATPQERSSIQSEIDSLMAKVPVGSREYTAPAHQAKLSDLYGKLYGSANIVGSNQRVA